MFREKVDVGLFWWYRRKMALDVIGFRQILICRKSGLQVKHLAFFVALLDGVESCEKIVFISILNTHLYLYIIRVRT